MLRRLLVGPEPLVLVHIDPMVFCIAFPFGRGLSEGGWCEVCYVVGDQGHNVEP